jgi:formamidopyrimidine-DNA glycosylase
MPELPEVETVVRLLRLQLVGRVILSLRTQWARHIDRPQLPEFQSRIKGRAIEDVYRRGKFILVALDQEETLIVHLRMTGHLTVVDASLPPDKHTHTIFELDSGQELRFRDPRKFGRVYLVRDVPEVVGGLGPEPLDSEFTPEVLSQILSGRKRILKPFLLDQSMIAGIGNIYADEALFNAQLLPTRRTDSLSADEIAALFAGIQEVLHLGIAREGASISTYVKPDGEKGDMQNEVKVFRRTGEACYRCGEVIQRIILGGRSTHFCPGCQY